MYLTETERLLHLLVSSTYISGGYCTTQTRLLLCHCVTHLTEMHCPTRSFYRTPSNHPQHKFKVKASGCPDMVVNVGIRSVGKITLTPDACPEHPVRRIKRVLVSFTSSSF